MRLASFAAKDGWVDRTVPFLLSAGVTKAAERVLAVAFRNKQCWFESHYRHIHLCSPGSWTRAGSSLRKLTMLVGVPLSSYFSFCLSFSARRLTVLAPDHTQWHTALGRNPLDEESARQRPPQETDIHIPGGILTCNSSKRTAADPRLRRRGHRDRPSTRLCHESSTFRVPKGKNVTALTAAWHGADFHWNLKGPAGTRAT